MSRSPWERIEERLEREIDAASLRWLCGCGESRPYSTSKAYPICGCGQRMLMLDDPAFRYATDARQPRA